MTDICTSLSFYIEHLIPWLGWCLVLLNHCFPNPKPWQASNRTQLSIISFRRSAKVESMPERSPKTKAVQMTAMRTPRILDHQIRDLTC